MSTNYVGNPIAIQAPSSAPGVMVAPTVVLPADTDPFNAAAFAQQLKVFADFNAYLTTRLFRAVGFITYANATPTIDASLGISSVAEDSSSGIGFVDITLSANLPTANFSAFACTTSTPPAICGIVGRSQNGGNFGHLLVQIVSDAGVVTRRNFMIVVFCV